MSTAPRVVSPSQRVNEYTVLVEMGAKDGLSEGDTVMLDAGGDKFLRATVIDVTENKSVLEIETA